MIEPIVKKNVSDEAFSSMMEMILTGKWTVGSKIPSEIELKERFQISRNSVRQSIHRLRALGLVEARQGEGTFIKKLDTSFYLNIMIPTILLGAENPIKIMEYQKGIQIECAKLACLRCTDEQVAMLFEYVKGMSENIHDHKQYLENDIAFHVMIANMTCNELFIKSMSILKSLLFYTLKDIVDTFDSAISIDFHQRIGQAVKERNALLAAELMDEHMQDVITKMLKVVKKSS